MILKTVDRALTLLRLLAEADGPLSVRELAEKLDINLTTAYHVVNTLAAQDFATHVGGQVELGPSAALLSVAYRRRRPLSEELERVVRRVAEQTGETTYLGEWNGANLVVRAVSESSESLRVAGIDVGYSGQEHLRASGLAVLSQLPTVDLRKFVARLQGSGVALDESGLVKALAPIAENGYAEERGIFSPGAACLAAPYLKWDGSVGGALAVSAPIERYEENRTRIMQAVSEAASEITERLSLEG